MTIDIKEIWEDEKEHIRDVLDYLKDYAVAILLCGIILTAVAGILFAVQGVVLNPPSEEQCQKYHGNNTATFQRATQYWCEYDGSKWHFNKTLYKEMMIAGALT